MKISNTVKIDGKTVGLADFDGNNELYMLPLKQLNRGYLYADNKNELWEWVFAGIMGAIGLFMFFGGIFMILSACGLFPDRESGLWNIGIPGVISTLIGTWLSLSGIGMALGFTRLSINHKHITLEEVFLGRKDCIYKGTLSNEDHLMCHLREDAEQDFYSVSLELMLPEQEKCITLFLNGVSCKPEPGQSFEDAMNSGLTQAATKVFDKAKEIKECLNIKISY